jgi:hypothetical protein
MHTRKTAYAAEFLGTFLLVLFIGLILASNSNAGLGSTDFAVVGLLHAFVLTMLVATLGALSGAHFKRPWWARCWSASATGWPRWRRLSRPGCPRRSRSPSRHNGLCGT